MGSIETSQGCRDERSVRHQPIPHPCLHAAGMLSAVVIGEYLADREDTGRKGGTAGEGACPCGLMCAGALFNRLQEAEAENGKPFAAIIPFGEI